MERLNILNRRSDVDKVRLSCKVQPVPRFQGILSLTCTQADLRDYGSEVGYF